MRRALEYGEKFDLPVIGSLSGLWTLVSDGVMHEGYWRKVSACEAGPRREKIMLWRETLLLAEADGANVHCQHLSTEGSVAVAAGGPQTRRTDRWRRLAHIISS